jgi:hypothetical protein
MLDFFSRASKKQQNPFSNAADAKQWVEGIVAQHGAAAHERVIELLEQFNSGQFNNSGSGPLSADTLEALLTLNLETQPLHDQLCAQYLMNTRMPKVLEAQLRSQILAYGKEFQDAYQKFVAAEFQAERDSRIHTLLPLVVARMLHYAGEFARSQYYRHFSPDEVFWLNVNQLYQYAESERLDTVPILLFGDRSGGTTVQDQFLILHMLALLHAGNMNLKQVNFAYRLLSLLSNRLLWRHDYGADVSFAVLLSSGRPAQRCADSLNSSLARYWSSAELVETMIGWLASMEAGKAAKELQALMEPGIDAALLRHLCREWSPKPVVLERAERQLVANRNIEVANRFPMLHALIRRADKQQPGNTGRAADDNFEDASDIRIYGFVTSRRKERTPGPAVAVMDQSVKDEFASWNVENISESGLGVTLNALGCEWVGLGRLLGYRDESSSDWSLGLIRRIKHQEHGRVYLGIETLSARPVAASLAQADGKAIDLNTPQELSWQGGQIGLFVPTRRGGRSINALILPLVTYTLGRQLYMSARGKHFIVALGKVLEKGADWCLAEIELVKSLEKAPIPGP